MIKVKTIIAMMIEEFGSEFPGYRFGHTVRKVMLRHYGYGRWTRNVTVAHANAMMRDMRAVIYLERIDRMVSDAAAGGFAVDSQELSA